MKNILAVIAFLTVLFGGMVWAGYLESTYDLDAKVTQTHGTEVTVEDRWGDEWVFDAESKGDYKVNDNVRMVMAMNGTEHYKYDDVIVKVKKVK